ncbi:MAG: hypothetical protein MR678_02385 [Muribaculaceae bacterium]|nr:hypothetical protein [Muribaculaceae bacterium]
MEYHQLEMQQHQQEADKRIDEVFRRLDEGNAKPKQAVFYNGQIYDAYTFVSDLIKSAKKRIVLIDKLVIFQGKSKRIYGKCWHLTKFAINFPI